MALGLSYLFNNGQGNDSISFLYNQKLSVKASSYLLNYVPALFFPFFELSFSSIKKKHKGVF